MTANSTGRRIGSRYLLRRPLGVGGICTVYESVHLFTSRRVAVKVLNDEYVHHEEARLRLLDEARALGIVRHPNVVEVFDAGSADRVPYVVMELLEGRNLEGLLTSRGRLNPSDTVNIVRQVALGLGAAHAVGIVHRDVKPGNVVIVRTPIGREKATLIDFGVARLPRGSDKVSQRFGGSEGAVGTPEYMAPEQLVGSPDLDGRADIYAVGVLLWECLTERVPIAGPWHEVVAAHSQNVKLSLRRTRPDLPAALTDLVDRCLLRDPRDRFADMKTLVRALDATGLARAHTNLLDVEADEDPSRGPRPNDTIPDPNAAARALAASQDQSRRRRSRAPFNAPVRVSTSAETVDVRAEDISEHGMLAIGPRGFVVGEAVQLRFAMPGTGDVVTTNAAVRWIRNRAGSSHTPCAIGFQFVDPPAPVRSAITTYVSFMLQR